jgi:hypothetical protein
VHRFVLDVRLSWRVVRASILAPARVLQDIGDDDTVEVPGP